MERNLRNKEEPQTARIQKGHPKDSNLNKMKRQRNIQQVRNMRKLLEISGEITPERMKGWSQRKNNPVVDGTGDRNKIQCCKEQYCIGTWNVRSMNQGKVEGVKQ